MTGWISVDEQLPAPNTEVLVYPGWACRRRDGSAAVGISEYWEKWGWMCGIEDGWRPTHWQPLPDVPAMVTT